ncbi:MAG: hypothetical protein ACPGKO_08590 [Pseudohongiellaceae bacterium]
MVRDLTSAPTIRVYADVWPLPNMIANFALPRISYRMSIFIERFLAKAGFYGLTLGTAKYRQ